MADAQAGSALSARQRFAPIHGRARQLRVMASKYVARRARSYGLVLFPAGVFSTVWITWLRSK